MTAYEVRISDWSADVCSSDLVPPTAAARMSRTVPQAATRASIRKLRERWRGLSSDGSRRSRRREGTAARSSAGLHDLAAKRSEEHTSELQSLMRSSYAVFCLNKTKNKYKKTTSNNEKI